MSNMAKRGKLFVVSASSGAGKTTLVTHAIERLRDEVSLKRVTTYTTRAPRSGEVDGKDYVFINKEEFAQKKKDSFFLETSEFDGHDYGSPLSVLEELQNGTNLVAITDRNGAHAISNEVDDAILIWIVAPDVETLKHRMKKRNENSPGQIERRLKIAISEMEEENKQRQFKYHLVNDEFERAVAELMLIIKEELGAIGS